MCCPQLSLKLEVDLDNDPGSFGGSATNRKCTDLFGLIIVVLFFGAVIGLSTYCILNSDIEKITNGYDDCGNICGRNNNLTDFKPFKCFGENMEDKKYIYLINDGKKIVHKECILFCVYLLPDKILELAHYYCVDHLRFIPYSIITLEFWKFALISWLLSALFVGEVFRLHSNTHCYNKYRFSVWALLNALYIWTFVCSSYKWNNEYIKEYLIIAIISTVALVLYISWLFPNQMSLKFDLADHLYQESWKAIKSMPLFWLLPLLSSLIIIGFVIALTFCLVWLQSFSYLDQIRVANETKIDYVPYPIAIVTGALVIYAFILLYEIVRNCQCMIVGGCAAQWYFTRRDVEVSKPMRRTIVNLLKYHLGTICFGSLILPLVYVLRAVLNTIKGAASGYNKESVYTCSCRLLSETCLASFITCLDSFSQNGFIMTAIYGCSFCEGTIRAHKLVSHNIFNVAAIKSFGDSFLLTFKFLPTVSLFIFFSLILLAFPYDLSHQKIGMFFFATVSFIIIDISLSLIEVTIDTLFLCFCEDILYNNGTSKPYNMSPNFAQFVEDANKYVNAVKWKEVADKWEKGPKQLY